MIRRRRLVYGVAVIVVVGLGLASRRFPGLLPVTFGKYPGDVLWALMVFLLWGFWKRDVSTRRLAVYALVTCYLDEFSQVYQSPWINGIRATTVGHLVLGSTFSWWDMGAYTLGVGLGIAMERAGQRVLFEALRCALTGRDIYGSNAGGGILPPL